MGEEGERDREKEFAEDIKGFFKTQSTFSLY